MALDLPMIVALVIGDSGVGKSWLIHNFVQRDNYYPKVETVGVDFAHKAVTAVDGNAYKLRLWDVAGKVKYQSIVVNFFRTALGFLLVFDVTSKESFCNALGRWKENIQRYGCDSTVPVILVGNKCDCYDKEREVSRDRIHTICDEMNLHYIEVSAKEGINVDFVFEEIVKEMLDFKNKHEN